MADITTSKIDALLDDAFVSKGSRSMTPAERQLMQRVYGNAVNFSKVRIRKGTVLTVLSDALTIRNTISYDEDSFQDDFSPIVNDMALLCHELCHVWQHQNPKIDYSYWNALGEHIEYGDEVYEYDLDTNNSLTDYRFEQQGKILQDYYPLLVLGLDVTNFEKVIYSSIEK